MKIKLLEKIPKAKVIKNIIIVLGFSLVLFFSLYNFPDLTRKAQSCLVLFFLATTLWVTRLIPLAATSLLVLVMLSLLGIFTSTKAFALFGNEAVFFILGALVLSTGLRFSGLSKRLALFFLDRLKGGAKRLLFGVMFSSLFLSFWMPEHAVVAMLLPLIIDIVKALDLEKGKSNYAKSIFIALAWGAIVGGVATLLGGARNPLAIAILKEHYGITIGFFDWMIAAVPLVFFTGIITFIVIRYFFPPEISQVGKAREYLRSEITNMGKITFTEIRMGIIMLVTVFFWIFFSEQYGLANIAILGAVAIFAFRIVKWPDIEKDVYWGAVLMYGGAIALAKAMAITGAAKWLILQLIDGYSFTPILLIAFLALITKAITETMSNSAAVALILPVAFVLGDQFGVMPITIVFTVAITSGLAFCLPIGTPPNALCFATGYYSVKDVVKAGLVLNVISWLIFLINAYFYWPLLGWH